MSKPAEPEDKDSKSEEDLLLETFNNMFWTNGGMIGPIVTMRRQV